MAREKKLFKRWRDTFYGLLVPAHIASYYRGSCSEFAAGLRKPYVIDPGTYIFARARGNIRRTVKDKRGRKSKGEVRRSYAKLVKAYGGVIEAAVTEDRPLEPSDVADETVARQFVRTVLAFQRTTLSEVPEKYRKYEKYADVDISAPSQPAFLIAPYFHAGNLGSDGWHERNIDCVRISKQEAGELPVFAVVCVDLNVLVSHLSEIVQAYRAAGPDGFILWFNRFDAKQSARVAHVAEVVSAFADGPQPVLSMSADAFALVLYFRGLAGFCCGLCYGESRDVDQDMDMEGGIPPRYYLAFLKRKVRLETLARADLEGHPDLVCECPICEGRTEVHELTEDETREHFLHARSREIQAIRNGLRAGDFKKALLEAYEKYDADALFGPVRYLQRWAALLEE